MNFIYGKNYVRKIKNEKKLVVNYFQHRRWQLITSIEQLAGIWPYQIEFKQYSLQFYHFIVLLSIFLGLGNNLRNSIGADTDMVIEGCLLLLFMFGLILKLIFTSIFKNTRGKIYEIIADNFGTITDPEEALILEKRSDEGFKYVTVYLCTVCFFISVFDAVPVIRSFFYYFYSNGELNMMPIPMDYGFDHKTYWYIIVLDYLMFVYSGILVELAHDMPFIMQVRHVEALFEIVSLRLHKASEIISSRLDDDIVSDDAVVDESYSLLSSAIDLHSECLKMVEMIEETYTINWFIILLLSTAGFGGGLYMVSTKLHVLSELFRYSCLYIVIILHFQVIFSQGQRITDSSSTVAFACYDCKWYDLPKKSSKVLLTMMVRTSTPCGLTGAKLFPLSMETFSQMLKAGLSYYTVFQT